MHLDDADSALFLAVVRAFVSALPPSPARFPNSTGHSREPQSEDQRRDQRKRDNVITFLRFEVHELASVLNKDRAVSDLPDDAFDKASEALEDVLNLLDGIVDDRICGSERNVLVVK